MPNRFNLQCFLCTINLNMKMNNQWLSQTDHKQCMGWKRVFILVNYFRQCWNEKKCQNNQNHLQLVLVEKTFKRQFPDIVWFNQHERCLFTRCLSLLNTIKVLIEHNFKLICGIKCTIGQSLIAKEKFSVWFDAAYHISILRI